MLSDYFQAQINSYATGSTALGLKAERMVYLKLVVPPVAEQQHIVDIVEEKTSKIDELIVRTELSINLLKERRSALITAAVTGQIDVRGE